ncbi:MAG: GNAT family N-acetyltransferase [Mycobacterium sp.]|nr:GNAT family N-acetyltransferase [Mycobacterium sp.]
MDVTPLRTDLIDELTELMELGRPFITLRTRSDYWVYATLFSGTCLVAVDSSQLVGAMLAFRSQDEPGDMYIQDVLVHPNHRDRGIARALIGALRDRTASWGCRRLWLTSDPRNATAHRAWLALGFTNLPGDQVVDGVEVVSDFKGPGRDRALYELPVTG